MDASRFDDLARRLADPLSRRHLAQILGGAAMAGGASLNLASQPALAVPQLTAECADGSPSSNLSTLGIALTFTPEISGKLSEASVKIFHSFEPEGVGYIVRILGTDETGKPKLSRVLAKKTIPYDVVEGGSHPLIATFKKRKAAKVEAGKSYAIFVTRTQADLSVGAVVRSGNPCTDANLFDFNAANKSFTEQPDSDGVFEAFVGY